MSHCSLCRNYAKVILLVALAITLYSFSPQSAIADGNGGEDPPIKVNPDSTDTNHPIALPDDPTQEKEINWLMELFLLTL